MANELNWEFEQRDGFHVISLTALIGHRLVDNPPGLPAGKYIERLGYGVPDKHHHLFGPIGRVAAIETDKGPVFMIPASVHWWDIVGE